MSDLPRFVFEDGRVEAKLDLRVYRLSAIKKAAYRVARGCTAVLGSPVDERLPISFTFKPETTEKAALEAVRLFFEELLDHELREHVAQETAPIRTLILAQAFSKTDLIRRE